MAVAVLKIPSESYVEHVSASCFVSNSKTQSAFSVPVKTTFANKRKITANELLQEAKGYCDLTIVWLDHHSKKIWRFYLINKISFIVQCLPATKIRDFVNILK